VGFKMNICSRVEKALRKRECKCGKQITKGEKCFRIEGYQSSQNICVNCIKDIYKEMNK
jgi:hypothetical protein